MTMRLRPDCASGLWAQTYRASGTGVMLSTTGVGWALSGAVVGRGVLVGWIYRRRRDRKVSVGLEGSLIVLRYGVPNLVP